MIRKKEEQREQRRDGRREGGRQRGVVAVTGESGGPWDCPPGEGSAAASAVPCTSPFQHS